MVKFESRISIQFCSFFGVTLGHGLTGYPIGKDGCRLAIGGVVHPAAVLAAVDQPGGAELLHMVGKGGLGDVCLLYTSPSPRDS